jgi:hypothetical protein
MVTTLVWYAVEIRASRPVHPYRGSEGRQALGTPLFLGMLCGVNFMVAYACFEPGRFIEETDPDATVHFLSAGLRFWF